MSKKPLKHEELVYYMDHDDSELDCLSEDDDGWEIESYQQEGFVKIDLFMS